MRHVNGMIRTLVLVAMLAALLLAAPMASAEDLPAPDASGAPQEVIGEIPAPQEGLPTPPPEAPEPTEEAPEPTEEPPEPTEEPPEPTEEPAEEADGEEPVSFRIRFLDWEGRELFHYSLGEGEEIAKPKHIPARDGYEFLYWHIQGRPEEPFRFKVPAEKDLVLVPLMAPIPEAPPEEAAPEEAAPQEPPQAAEPPAEEEARQVRIRMNVGERVLEGQTIVLTAEVTGCEGLAYRIDWLADDGSGFRTVQEDGGETHTFVLDTTNYQWLWQARVTLL